MSTRFLAILVVASAIALMRYTPASARGAAPGIMNSPGYQNRVGVIAWRFSLRCDRSRLIRARRNTIAPITTERASGKRLWHRADANANAAAKADSCPNLACVRSRA